MTAPSFLHNLSHTQRKIVWLMVLALLAGLVAELLHRSGVLNPIDQRINDTWVQFAGKRADPKHVVIVAIDEATLRAYPEDPMIFWTNRLSTAVSRLRSANVRIVGLDMLLSISPERWLGKISGMEKAAREYDRPFREQINSGQLILASTRFGDGSKEGDYALPSPDYLLALPDFDIPGHIALADLFDEGDGIVRRFLVTPVASQQRKAIEGNVPVFGLPSLLAIRASGQDPGKGEWQLGGIAVKRDQPPVPIAFFGPPNTFKQISLHRLLEAKWPDQVLIDELKGKVVLIGTTAPGFNDDHFTPYSTRFIGGRGQLMAGVELHANVVEALLTGTRLQTIGESARLMLLFAATLAAVYAFSALPAWLGATTWLLSSALIALASYLAFRNGAVVPVAFYILACALTLLGTLGWRLTGEERERAHLRQMFGRYVSDQVVESLLNSGQRLELGGQSQGITVLFSDIRNFTTISEMLNAREVVEMLNTYFERACAVLLAEGGSIDKFIGDAIMVEFGSPMPAPDHAQRGLRAAIALRQVGDEFAHWMKKRFPDRNLPDFALGIGVHTGEAVIGNIGSRTRMEFTAIGDTVNLASRLEGMTKALGCVILASETTMAEAGDGFVFGRSEVIQVKGREAAVRVFEVVGHKNGDQSNA